MKLTNVEIKILKYLLKHQPITKISTLKRDLLTEYKYTQPLKERDLLDYNSFGEMWLTEHGEKLIIETIESESKLIHEHIFTDYTFTVSQFLLNRQDPVQYTEIPQELQAACKPANGQKGNIVQWLHENSEYFNSKDHYYSLSSLGVAYYKRKLEEYKKPLDEIEIRNAILHQLAAIPIYHSYSYEKLSQDTGYASHIINSVCTKLGQDGYASPTKSEVTLNERGKFFSECGGYQKLQGNYEINKSPETDNNKNPEPPSINSTKILSRIVHEMNKRNPKK